MPTLLRAAVAVVVAVASLLLLPGSGPADAAPTWLTPAKVVSDPSHEAADVDVAVAPGGHTLVVWWEQVGASFVVKMTERGPGGLWTVPVPLYSSQDPPQSMTAEVDDTGRAAVAWMTANSSGALRVRVTRRPPGGDWTSPTSFGNPVNASQPDLALGRNGEVFLTYVIDTGVGKQVVLMSATDANVGTGRR